MRVNWTKRMYDPRLPLRGPLQQITFYLASKLSPFSKVAKNPLQCPWRAVYLANSSWKNVFRARTKPSLDYQPLNSWLWRFTDRHFTLLCRENRLHLIGSCAHSHSYQGIMPSPLASQFHWRSLGLRWQYLKVVVALLIKFLCNKL